MALPDRTTLIAASVAAISVAALIWCWSYPHPSSGLDYWIKSTRVADLTRCPPDGDPGIDAFGFNGKSYAWCLADGPYHWNGKDWYVQRINDVGNPIGGPRDDIVRVCSPQAKRPASPIVFVRGPCATASGTDYGGCEICTKNGMVIG